MPRHQQVTTCRKSGPVSDRCSCEHCTLAVCSVCGAYEGGLTTDCPGSKVSFDRRQEVYETNLDYSDDRGWHQGQSMKERSPRFEPVPVTHAPILVHARFPYPAENYSATRIAGCTCGWRTLPSVDDSNEAFARHITETKLIQRRSKLQPGSCEGPPDTRSAEDREEAKPSKHMPLLAFTRGVAARIAGCTCGWLTPSSVTDSDTTFSMHLAAVQAAPDQATDWAAIDRTADLQRELAKKAIAWVLADRVAEDHSASYDRVTKEAEARMRSKTEPNDGDCALLARLEHEKIGFHLADQRAQKCDDEFRQAARKLVAELEKVSPVEGSK